MTNFTENFMSSEANIEFLKQNMMGPNAIRLSEELTGHLTITPGMRILDLGCGSGLSTLLLCQKYGASVFAADLWISPTENYERFQALGIDKQAVPIFADVTKGLPFAHGYFDMLFTMDAYHYFGSEPGMLESLIPLVKKGGCIAIAIPGLTQEFGDNVPAGLQPIWNSEIARTMHSLDWWKNIWSKTEGLEILDTREMRSTHQAWKEWHSAYFPGIAEDIKMMEAGGYQYINFIQMIARVL